MSAFDWKQLAGPLAKAGAGALGTILGGPAGGAIGAGVGGILAEALGVPAEPEAVVEAVEANPAAAREALASRDSEVAAIIAKANADIIATINETYRQELRHEGVLVYGARPSMIWANTFIWTVFMLVFAWKIMSSDAAFYAALPVLLPVLMTMFGIPGAIVGVIAHGRSKEKIEGVAGSGGKAGAGEALGGLIGAAVGKVIRK